MITYWWDVSKYDGKLNAKKIKQRGVTGIIHRCVIGIAPRDPNYFDNKEICEGEGLKFATYGVMWPANRNPEKEAEHYAESLVSGASPRMPDFCSGDFELGAASSDKYGHYKLSGEELVEMSIRYMVRLETVLPGMPLEFYTAAWYWNSKKLRPYVNRGENQWSLWDATYPFNPAQIPGLPPRYSKDVLSPYEINPQAKYVSVYPWTADQTNGWQWTSKGRGAIDGYCAEKVFIDRDIMWSPELPPPTDAQELRHLVTWEQQKGYVPLEGWK